MNTPLISIVSASFNNSKFIKDSIESVISQSFINWELIIVDDCSTDNSVDLIESLIFKESRIKLVKLTKNQGAAFARNTGIVLSTGRYLTFIDSDDFWEKDFLLYSLNFCKTHNRGFIFSGYKKVDLSGNVFEYFGVPIKINYKELLKGTPISCLTAFIDTNIIGKHLMPTNTLREDFAYWLKLLKICEFAYGADFCLANYRVHSLSSSSNKFKMAWHNWKLYRDVENLSYFSSIYYFFHYSFRSVLRLKFPNLARKFGYLNSFSFLLILILM